MPKERKDTWTKENDKTLATIVVEHLMNGSTQTKAFNEAAEKLNRTTAACGFRWNSTIRKEYENEIKEAKKKKVNKSKFHSDTVSKENAEGNEAQNSKKKKTENLGSKKSAKKNPIVKGVDRQKSATKKTPTAKTTNDINFSSSLKVKDISSFFEGLDPEMSVADVKKLMEENNQLQRENEELKEEIRSVYLILDRVRKSAKIEMDLDKKEAN
ncbi:hypothetical protein [Evansella tamaricis]|uniref:Myb-like domain-containing protein n=1 Tax=Evansella tamaricis TaxID=2069301 RepID=A0ABS6JHT2_9BACI|nr:hypothetical protein [Evansella tamaricis]MBU9713196.1 hypothetical protein [Evansella tamaricis]